MAKQDIEAQSDYLKECLRQGFFELLAEKPYEKISVSEIVKRAGVSRMSFYRYYETKEDIVRQYILDSFGTFMGQVRGKEDSTLLDSTSLFFCYFRSHKDRAQLLINQGLFYLYQERFVEFLEEFNSALNVSPKISKKGARYYYVYTSGGLLNVIREWVCNGMKESDKDMAIIIKEIKEAQGKRYST